MDEAQLAGLQLYQVIELMAPLSEQATPTMWPQTWGWLLVASIVAGLVLAVYIKRRKRAQKFAHRKAAIKQIQQLEADFSALQISAILKRCVLHEAPRQQIASLSSSQWIAFLNRHAPEHVQFNNFYTLNYAAKGFDRTQLKVTAVAWINGFTL